MPLGAVMLRITWNVQNCWNLKMIFFIVIYILRKWTVYKIPNVTDLPKLPIWYLRTTWECHIMYKGLLKTQIGGHTSSHVRPCQAWTNMRTLLNKISSGFVTRYTWGPKRVMKPYWFSVVSTCLIYWFPRIGRAATMRAHLIEWQVEIHQTKNIVWS